MAIRAPVKVPTLDESISRVMKLPEDITLIRERVGINRSQLARILGVSRVEVSHWEKGTRAPREPLIVLSLISWADLLRNPTS
jgi:DNA-binding transcriptional regulator YiaG